MKKSTDTQIHFEYPSYELYRKIKLAKQELGLKASSQVMHKVFISHLCPEFCDQCEILRLCPDGQLVLEDKLTQVGFQLRIELEDLYDICFKCLNIQTAEFRIISDYIILAAPLYVENQIWGVVRLSTSLKRIKNKQDYLLCINELIELLFTQLEKQLNHLQKI